ncbi:hypothetical protein PpBr36_06918 [Pyricularia pennisetigena]|uniref:hypothetical protein n=1 Tax=Pyricularia pennisetigena TaxID=1578925 RepID=UPI00114E7F89|nr:hypothetical protein PpBr36_06918 [Pyricularia pennisetigena]TLS25235.1 hypothetical protein PpBr36_06918 [Pyricularia pennisetigena]
MQLRTILVIAVAITHAAPALAVLGDCFVGLYEKGGRNPNHVAGKETDESGIFEFAYKTHTIGVGITTCQLVWVYPSAPSGYEVQVIPKVGYNPYKKRLIPSQPRQRGTGRRLE